MRESFALEGVKIAAESMSTVTVAVYDVSDFCVLVIGL